MKSAWKSWVGVLAIAGTMALFGAARAQAQDAKPATGGYKIGVVDRSRVIKGYNKVKAEYGKLQADVDDRQKKIDDMSTKIDAAKKKYDAEKADMSDTERNEREAQIMRDFREYQAELEKQQADIDSKEGLLMKGVMSDIDAAVSKIGLEQQYHLILDGSKRGGALWFDTSIDITQKVIDILNAQK